MILKLNGVPVKCDWRHWKISGYVSDMHDHVTPQTDVIAGCPPISSVQFTKVPSLCLVTAVLGQVLCVSCLLIKFVQFSFPTYYVVFSMLWQGREQARKRTSRKHGMRLWKSSLHLHNDMVMGRFYGNRDLLRSA